MSDPTLIISGRVETTAYAPFMNLDLIAVGTHLSFVDLTPFLEASLVVVYVPSLLGHYIICHSFQPANPSPRVFMYGV